MTIVGVARDVKHPLDAEVKPEYYLPHAQDPWGSMAIAAHTRVEPLALAGAIRGEVLALDPINRSPADSYDGRSGPSRYWFRALLQSHWACWERWH